MFAARRMKATEAADDRPARPRRRPYLLAGRTQSREAFARRHRLLQYVLAGHLPGLTLLLIASDVGLVLVAAAVTPVGVALALSLLCRASARAEPADDAETEPDGQQELPFALPSAALDQPGGAPAASLPAEPRPSFAEQLDSYPASPADVQPAAPIPAAASRAAAIDVLPGSAAPVPLPRDEAPTRVPGLVAEH